MYFSFEVVRQIHSAMWVEPLVEALFVFCPAPSDSVPTPPSTDDTCKLVLPCLLTEADLLHVSFLSATSLVVVAVVVPTLVVVIVLVVLLMVIVLWVKFKRQGKQERVI